MKRTSLLLVALVTISSCSRATAPSPLRTSTVDVRVDSVVRMMLLSQGVPSASVAVMKDGRMVIQRAWGTTDDGRNATAETIYQSGSLAKQFTAALVMKQVDRGRVSLNDPIGRYIAGLKPELANLPIELLLNHTSGLKGDFRSPDRSRENLPVDSLLAMANRDTVASKPGTAFLYSNTGYMLLAVLVERLYATSYADALQNEIARPLGLTHTARCGDAKPGEATGHMRTRDGKVGPPPGLHYSQTLGSGGICTTPGDLVKWTVALHNGRVVSAASYAAMTTPRGAAVSDHYGFGLYIRPAPWGSMAMVHGGSTTAGFTGELQWYPKERVAFAVMYDVGPRVPGFSDLIPRIVMGVPLPSAPAAGQ